MAIGVIRLTKRGRYIFSIIFVVLDVIQALLGFATTSWSVYICIAISPTLYTEKSEITFVFAVIGMYGTHVIFHGLLGIKICYKCYAQSYKKSTKKLLLLWILVALNTLINIFILVILTARMSKHIIRSLKQSVEKGMHNYLKDPNWKLVIDTMQVKIKCCGVSSYEDWYKITWIDEYKIKVDDNLVHELRISQTALQVPVTPWSCCRTDYPMQCFHDPFQQVESAYLWKEQPSIVVESIYTEGCLIVVKKPIEMALFGLLVITFLIFFVQILAVLVSRIVYTACRNAIILNDPDGVAPGWIFGRGDCGWARGPGLAELMGMTPTELTLGTSKIENKSSSKSSRRPSKSKAVTKNLLQTQGALLFKSDTEPVSSGDEEALMLQ